MSKNYNCLVCIYQYECPIAYSNLENRCNDYTKENIVCTGCVNKKKKEKGCIKALDVIY